MDDCIKMEYPPDEVRDHKFFGKPLGEMTKEELLTVISFYDEERERLKGAYYAAERLKAEIPRGTV